MTTTSTAPATSVVVHPEASTKRAKVPTVLQMEVTECGAASLAMVLAHYGRWVGLDEMRERTGASRDGTSAADLIRTAREFGMEGAGYRLSVESLDRHGYPLILFWKASHFVVLEGLDGSGGAYLNDPGTGPRRVTAEELKRDYSGICLALRPGEGFQPGGEKPQPWRGLIRLLRRVASEVLAVVVIGLLATVPGLAMALLSKLFIEEVLVRQSGSAAWSIVGALILVIALQALLVWAQQRILVRVAMGLTVGESARFVHRSLRLPEKYFMARSVSDLVQRIQHNRDVSNLVSGELATVGIASVVVIVYGVAMVLISPWLAAVAIGLTLVNLIALRWALQRRRDAARLLTQSQGQMYQVTAYGATNLETIKSGGLESDYFARWEGTAVRLADTRNELAMTTQWGNGIPMVITSLVSASVMGLGALLVINGSLELGSFVAFQSLVISFTAPISSLVMFAWMLQQVQNMITRLDDVLNEPLDPSCDPEIQVFEIDGGPPRLRGAVSLNGVTFGYKTTAAPLIEDFSLDVPPGARVAVVGTSGSGKSTLVRLLAGLYEPWSGSVSIDGRARHEIPRGSLALSLAMVDQRIALFSGTIRDNLTLWDHSIDEADLIAATRDAQIHDAIVSRAGGYSSAVADGGDNFSGGQRQRLEIARALVRNPSILLLDEATSALDTETEAAVEAALRRRGCTTIIVAHRLSTVRDSDLILVMHQGKVVESGTHDELIERNGTYARLVQE
jgi:NHLM bacteriocin system ABC transporter peptidase/ATP-binding protein